MTNDTYDADLAHDYDSLTRQPQLATNGGQRWPVLLGLTGSRADLEGDVGVTGISSAVQAVVNWYGQADFLTMKGQRPDISRQAEDDPNNRRRG